MAISRGKPDLHDHRFGESPPLSLGVEEELLLVDAEGELVAASQAVLDSLPAPLAERVSSEVFAEQIELKTAVCSDVEEVLRELRETRRVLREAGFELIGSGLHPTAASGEAALVDKPRYEVVREDFGDLLSTPPCGLHVHVGIPDPDTAVAIANSFRLYLPLLQALSANSPFREGVDSGHASARASVVRSWPTRLGLHRAGPFRLWRRSGWRGLDHKQILGGRCDRDDPEDYLDSEQAAGDLKKDDELLETSAVVGVAVVHVE